MTPPTPRTLDLNADLGESFGVWRIGDDEAMLDLVTSANIACGFHAGDPLTLHRACAAAAVRGVAIGAQVGYRDLAGFGRRRMDVASADLTADVLYQIGALDGLARAVGSRVTYVKPHGALYNTSVTDERQAAAVIAALGLWSGCHLDHPARAALAVVGPPGSALLALAEAAGLRVIREVFADRAYTPEGQLVDRAHEGAVLEDAEEIAERVSRWALAGTLVAVDGSEITVDADTICVHGDTPGAVVIAQAVRRTLDDLADRQDVDLTIAAFAGP